ncbi:DEAD/DEAH box helicase [Dickeya dianthicola]|uniref:type I Zorya anti-phage system protein ZorD n=1 Tax=Dickeya dianthicola TaxID=204039 RepID=UPI00136EEC17|nr:type I Zorya anti-phage system protein ZorD [Dickeya dianthicola]MCI4218440.1 DEAD/DEAH box helicase [Dickeya dianthicola]MCI4239410.1 DEAD/DEAH box helicase [Dickeya dianthicola]MCI4254921.1 DEAD/DEAH box helicase [Dickeya dianthicola]MZG23433.1 DEAD/DEAH box helicase [Dickeya dianthicola]MZI90279.1 DEAD/DEAH box helicase [Dickeya dianthicola]
MLKRLLSKFKGNIPSSEKPISHRYQVEELGLSFFFNLADEDALWPLAAYMEQLSEEEYVVELSDRWLLTWDELYRLSADEEHQTSLPLLGIPEINPLKMCLAGSGSLSDADFSVYIRDWKESATDRSVQIERTGAIFHSSEGQFLQTKENWQLLSALQQFRDEQQHRAGENTNQLGWAKIRRLTKKAQAELDNYLAKTIVVKPESLKLKLRKATIHNTPVIEIEPSFDDQPAQWLNSFDNNRLVQDQYRVLGEDGSLSHVIISPEVKEVLSSVHSITGRRVAGDDAVSFIRNPYTFIGEEAASVVPPEQHEEALQDAHIFFHRFSVTPVLDDEEKRISSVSLVLEPIAARPQPAITFSLMKAHEFDEFIQELAVKLASGLPAGIWQGYELELSQLTLEQLEQYQSLLLRWQQEIAGIEFDEVLDLNKYGDRVIGIGEFEKISSSFLIKGESEEWLPETLSEALLASDFFDGWEQQNHAQLSALEERIDYAEQQQDVTVAMPWNEQSLPVDDAKSLLKNWQKKIAKHEIKIDGDTAEKNKRAVLQIEQNIEYAAYIKQRREALLNAKDAEPVLPVLLKKHIHLREHQRQGLAWLQQLFLKSPEETSGCLLADDMGLGKTLQILAFIVWYIEKNPDGLPTMIVAPVSLLDNWERELDNFFHTANFEVLKLYGNAVKAVKFHKDEIPVELRAQGIKNLLRPGWVGGAKIVLTTYETLRDQEFSLARQKWSIMVCDEAQKIKNPAALITHAANAIQAQFKVACTGTPVENTLVDLWSLFDFAQPGLLGALNDFGKQYLRPIEGATERNNLVLESLWRIIEVQTLRRTKKDIANLPEKIEDTSCKQLAMAPLQRDLYISSIASYQNRQKMQDELEQPGMGMLGLLHRLKLICAHPYSVKPDSRLREHSPKLEWMMRKLEDIASKGDDKVIIFTELRDIQRELQYAIHQRFGFKPYVINGDTSTRSESANSRQKLIDIFQQQPGFGIIILSTVAVGFGINVQKANHVIHFTRCWNPAKEDQATDRAYRIGQTKDVYVYYPTITDANMPTFEETLDTLLQKRRSLARDMLSVQGDLASEDFNRLLTS